MTSISPWQWALVALLVVLGVAFVCVAWKLANGAPHHSAKSGVLAGLGGGLVTGFAVGLSQLFLQSSMAETQAEQSWRASVQLTQTLHGFVPGDHSTKGISFAGKDLAGADFRQADLAGGIFRDANLRGANLDGADLRGADFIGADLRAASLRGAFVEGTRFQSANLEHALLGVEFKGAQANYETCWPRGTPAEVLNNVTATAYYDGNGKFWKSSAGRVAPCAKLP
ncbi:pentapeptide repeat-containing protein (plasmid) [Streptomyces sp. NBC_01232]|uniref:pentapeptide repeat-containing protein n=1 Tax=Streptomyces sp. NBC_01232 TaxID=2903786 RepID=UPI002E0E0673|nr:pentapeptide repeat-containing protein [Streptomyces sp. NBC_01232]